MIELTLSSILQDATGVTALCSTRIYPAVLPTDPVLPAIVYMFVGGSAHNTFNNAGIQKYRVEVSCWGNSYSDAVTLRAAVIAALNGYSSNNVSIQFFLNIDDFEHDLLQYRALAEFYVWAGF